MKYTNNKIWQHKTYSNNRNRYDTYKKFGGHRFL